MQSPQPRGLPARVYLPIVVVVAVLFLAVMAYLIAVGFGVTGSVFGRAGTAGTTASQPQQATNVEGGGPPPAVMTQLKTLQARIAAHPKDDVALTQLGDMYLTVNKFSDAIPLYERALKANPTNAAAQEGLKQAKAGLAAQQGNQ